MNWNNSSHRLGFALAVIIIVGVGYFYFFSKGESPQKDAPTTAPAAAEQKTPMTKADTAAKVTTGVVFKTSQGDIEIALFPDKAPKTVENFIRLSQSGFYTGTKFHRVIKNFMIQGGDPLSKDDSEMARWGTGGPGYQFDDEINDQKIVRGTLAMANAGPGTNGSQFFIVTAAAAPWLDGKHTAFGKVVKGMNIVDKIENTPTGERDIPKTPIVIQEILFK